LGRRNQICLGAAWAILIAGASLAPESVKEWIRLRAGLRFGLALGSGGRAHDLYHMLAFALPAYLAGRLNATLLHRLCWYALGAASGFALECFQRLFYGAPMEWRDVGSDALGVGVGALIAQFLAMTRPKRRKHSEAAG
jgi:hypothetical protein